MNDVAAWFRRSKDAAFVLGTCRQDRALGVVSGSCRVFFFFGQLGREASFSNHTSQECWTKDLTTHETIVRRSFHAQSSTCRGVRPPVRR